MKKYLSKGTTTSTKATSDVYVWLSVTSLLLSSHLLAQDTVLYIGLKLAINYVLILLGTEHLLQNAESPGALMTSVGVKKLSSPQG